MGMYACAVALRQQTRHTTIGEEEFPTIVNAWVTVALSTIFPELKQFIFQLAETSLISAIFFLVFAVFNMLVMLNLMIGILCEVVTSVTDKEKENRDVHAVHALIHQVFIDYDS